MNTYTVKQSEVKRHWYLLDASEVSLGRLSTVAASLLIGKQKPQITPHIDGGDYVVIINANDLVATGTKAANKIYARHSGYPGGLRQRSLKDAAEYDSTTVIRHAIRGMLPDNKLRKNRLERLKIYAGSEHSHEGQSPEVFSLKQRESK